MARYLSYVLIVVATTVEILAQCGTERVSVKNVTDADAGSVLTGIVPTTIAFLQSLPAARPLPENGRVVPVETTMYSLTATVVEFRRGDDSDYELVLADQAGRTIVAEIPSPACASGSRFAPEIGIARAIFENKYQPTTDYQIAMVPVEVRGVGFFDFRHGQVGMAPNGIEIHPVTSINFSPFAPPPPPSSPRRRAARPTPDGGAPRCTPPTLVLTASRSRVCPGEPVVLTWQASDPAARVTVEGIGTNLPSTGSTTVSTTTPIAYSGYATTSCGSGTEAVAVVSVKPAGAASVSTNTALTPPPSRKAARRS